MTFYSLEFSDNLFCFIVNLFITRIYSDSLILATGDQLRLIFVEMGIIDRGILSDFVVPFDLVGIGIVDLNFSNTIGGDDLLVVGGELSKKNFIFRCIDYFFSQ